MTPEQTAEMREKMARAMWESKYTGSYDVDRAANTPPIPMIDKQAKEVFERAILPTIETLERALHAACVVLDRRCECPSEQFSIECPTPDKCEDIVDTVNCWRSYFLAQAQKDHP